MKIIPKHISIFLLILVNLSAYSQIENTKQYYLGFQTRLIDVFPIEFSFLSIKNNTIGYQIKTGFTYAQLNDVFDYYYNSSNENFKHEQSMKSIYTKFGMVISNFSYLKGSRFAALNNVLAVSQENLSLSTNDKIYGETIKTFNDNKLYGSIELEFQRIFDNGISLGFICGYKYIHPYAFDEIIQNIKAGSSFSPGQGFGKEGYINLQIGYQLNL